MESRYLSADTAAYSALEGEMPEDCFVEASATDWISGKNIKKQSELLEWSLPMNSYGQVLTLLYDEDGLSEYEEADTEDINNGGDTWPWDPPTFHKSKRK